MKLTLTAPWRWFVIVLLAGAAALVPVVTMSAPAHAAAGDDTWSANPAAPDTIGWRSVAWSPTKGVFVAVGSLGVMTSTNGTTWTAQTAPAAVWNGVVWSPELGLFAAIGTTGTAVITSPDGVTWTSHTITGATKPWAAITWSPGLHTFVVAAVGGGSMTSSDGITWTVGADSTRPSLTHGLAWSPALSLFVAVSNNGAYTSPDGVTWTLGASLPAAGWRGVAWSPPLSRFVAVGVGGTNDTMTSADGITWNSAPTPVTTTLNAVTWSPDEAEFVAVGQGAILTSVDGVTWSTVTDPAPANTWDSIVWAPAVKSYVGVSSDGASRTLVGVVPAAPVTPPTTGGGTTAPTGPRLATTGVDTGSSLLVGLGVLLLGVIALTVSLARSKRSRLRDRTTPIS